ncbi:transcription factor bHLH118 [Trifolium repens]|nr:transcription factor bHLH118 [Trifolium repens]
MAEENQHKILVTSDNDEKKIIRREVEKQRRMQMSILCSSLRSSLPLELIKGKRSVSDHIGEAANYVQFLKQNINELETRRDKLKEMASLSMVETGKELSSDPSRLVKCVKINILISGWG